MAFLIDGTQSRRPRPIDTYAILAAFAFCGCSESKVTSSPARSEPVQATSDLLPGASIDVKNGETQTDISNGRPSETATAVPTPSPPLSEAALVQADVRKMVAAVYDVDADTILQYTHPKIIESLGGTSQAKSALVQTLSQLRATGMKLDSMEFPAEPTFLKTNLHEFVIVPNQKHCLCQGTAS